MTNLIPRQAHKSPPPSVIVNIEAQGIEYVDDRRGLEGNPDRNPLPPEMVHPDFGLTSETYVDGELALLGRFRGPRALPTDTLVVSRSFMALGVRGLQEWPRFMRIHNGGFALIGCSDVVSWPPLRGDLYGRNNNEGIGVYGCPQFTGENMVEKMSTEIGPIVFWQNPEQRYLPGTIHARQHGVWLSGLNGLEAVPNRIIAGEKPSKVTILGEKHDLRGIKIEGCRLNYGNEDNVVLMGPRIQISKSHVTLPKDVLLIQGYLIVSGNVEFKGAPKVAYIPYGGSEGPLITYLQTVGTKIVREWDNNKIFPRDDLPSFITPSILEHNTSLETLQLCRLPSGLDGIKALGEQARPTRLSRTIRRISFSQEQAADKAFLAATVRFMTRHGFHPHKNLEVSIIQARRFREGPLSNSSETMNKKWVLSDLRRMFEDAKRKPQTKKFLFALGS